MLKRIKSGISKIVHARKHAFDYELRKSIAFFVEKAIYSEIYEASLSATHEPDEVKEQMLAAKNQLEFKAKFFMYKESIESKELKFDTYSKEQQDNLFISSVRYYRQYTDFFKYNSLKDWIETYISQYGKPKQLSELYLKATIKNDIELVIVLEQYL